MNKLIALGLIFIFLISGLSFIVMSPVSDAEPANIIHSQTSFAGNSYFGFQPNTSGNFTQYLNISNTTIGHNSYVNLSLGNYWINSTDVRGIFIPAIYAVWTANFVEGNFIASALALRANITIGSNNYIIPSLVFTSSYYSSVINLTYYFNITSLITFHQGFYPIYLNLSVNSTNDYTVYFQTMKWFNSALQSSQIVQVNHLVKSISQNVKFIKTQPQYFLVYIKLYTNTYLINNPNPGLDEVSVWVNGTEYTITGSSEESASINKLGLWMNSTAGGNTNVQQMFISGFIYSNKTYNFTALWASPLPALVNFPSYYFETVTLNLTIKNSYSVLMIGEDARNMHFITNINPIDSYYLKIASVSINSVNPIIGFMNGITYNIEQFIGDNVLISQPILFAAGTYMASLYYNGIVYQLLVTVSTQYSFTLDIPIITPSSNTYAVSFSTYNAAYITQWDITIYKNNTAIYASGLTSALVQDTLPNGEYTYSIIVPSSYGITNPTGSFIVNGNAVSLAFTEYNKFDQFTANFNSSNHITSWNVSVYLNGVLNSYSKNTFNNFSTPLYNGTYTYSIVITGNYSVHNRTGSFSINGKDITLLFTQSKLYTFVFYESGLPANTEWYVNLSNGQTNHSTSGQMIYLLLQGTYSFSAVASEYAYINNSITIPQTFEYVNLNFNSKVFTFNVYETGLLNGTEWYLNLSNGMSGHSQTNKITFSLQLGKVNYTAFAINYGQLTGSVIIPVNNLYLTFTSNYFTFTFLESGLASGKEWYVNLTNGMSNHTTSDKMTFKLQVGSYNYITDANAYNVNSGTISIPSVIYTTVNFTSATEIRNNTFYFFITGVTKGSAISLYINGTQYTTYNNTFILTLPVYNSSHYYNIYFANNSVYSTNFAPLKISNSSEHIYYVPYISNLPASISFFAQYSFYIYLLMFVGAFGLIGLSIKYAYRRRE